MKITIELDPKEIADLISELQGQQETKGIKNTTERLEKSLSAIESRIYGAFEKAPSKQAKCAPYYHKESTDNQS